ncbi:MAG TPA: hypothetical protein VMT32_15685 [Bryobacteraceae bacterium]|nr:hypothetical protein [Bryobacteraceae bacterium]
MGDGRYIDIPGSATHELPPLLVHGTQEGTPLSEVVGMAAGIVEAEDILGDVPATEDVFEQRKFDLALNLAEQYLRLMAHWQWGDSILEWIRQCEITFESSESLRRFLHPDVWPHAGRSSFVSLLMEKSVPTHGVGVENAVGLRLTFRQPPPIDCFSNQFLFYLNSTLTTTAYRTWARLAQDSPALFPPDRFHFQVVELPPV